MGRTVARTPHSSGAAKCGGPAPAGVKANVLFTSSSTQAAIVRERIDEVDAV
jgi:hypothetical protein